MALIRKLGAPENRTGREHDEVECKLYVVHTGHEILIQIDTFGRPTRKSEMKVSQTIQLDRAAARGLLSAIIGAFPDINPS